MDKARDTPRAIFETRLPPAANILWSCDSPASAEILERGFGALAGAGRAAVKHWPDFYHGEPSLRLLYEPADLPAAPVLAAARQAGLVASPVAGVATSGALDCDLAIVAPDQLGALAESMPGLALAPDRIILSLAARDASTKWLIDDRARPRETRTASSQALAQALFGPPRRSRERAKLREYLAEDADIRPLRFEFDVLLRLIGERPRVMTEDSDSWRRASLAAGPRCAAALRTLEAEYQRADLLAQAYGARWRSTLAARSILLFAANLISGLIGALFPFLAIATLPIQIGVTAFSYFDKSIARRGRWRAKWLDYRRVAELARISRFCVVAGAPIPRSKEPTWVEWRVARAVKAAPPAPPVGEANASALLTYLVDVEIGGQIAYHAWAHRRFRRLDARLRRCAAAALVGTMILGAAFALIAFSGLTRVSLPIMGAVGLAVVAGPGLYAALDGLRDQLDVVRQADRSARIGVALRGLRRAIAVAPAKPDLARNAAASAAAIMHEDVSIWDQVMEIV